jgi:dTDP-4-dehydrorhamnose reductase
VSAAPGRVLITGGSGLLATAWAAAVRDRRPVVLGLHERRIALRGVETATVNIESADEALSSLDATEPAVVVHTAGLTSVDLCETQPDLAQRVNVDLAEYVARACARRGVPLIHISTDHLFSGHAPFVDEDEPIRPVNAYGRTKGEAERRVLDAHPEALVVRTNFYGWGPGYRASFSDGIIASLRAGRAVRLFRDVFYTPIIAETLALVSHELQERTAAGVFHVVGDDRLSKLDFGLRLAAVFGLDASLITPGSIADHANLAPRPRDMSLSNRKATALLGRPLGGVDAHVARLRVQESEGLSGEIQHI